MKSKLLFAFILFAFKASAQLNDVGPVKIHDHPRLLLLAGEENRIKEQLLVDPNWRSLNRRLLNECDRMLPLKAVQREVTGKRLLDKSREALRRIFFLSYGWRVSGEKKYAEKAKQELLNIASFSDWHPDHYLDVGEMTLAAAIGYDWLFDQLSPNERTIVRNAIIEFGIKTSLDSRFNKFLTMNNNWNQVCNTGIALGAMAIAEDQPETCHQIVNRSIESIKTSMQAYQPDGAYPEGFGYWDYGTSYNVIFISALQKAYGSDFGLKSLPGFLKTGSFILHMTAPSGNCFNFSDTGLGNTLHPAMFWFADQQKDPSLLWFEKKHITNNELAVKEENRFLPLAMIWGAGQSLNNIAPPNSRFWSAKGRNPVALMRSDWSDKGLFLGIKGGTPSVSHGHMDVGSFVIEANGERWAADLGRQSYEGLESKGVDLWNMKQNSQRWSVFRLNNKSHNGLIINNELQNVKGSADIISQISKPALTGVIIDLTNIYNGLPSVKRGAAIVDKGYALIEDELQGGDQDVEIRWNLLTAAKVTVLNSKQLMLSLHGKKMILQLDWPGKFTFNVQPANPIQSFDEPNPGYTQIGIITTMASHRHLTLNSYLIPENVKVIKPEVRPLAAWSDN